MYILLFIWYILFILKNFKVFIAFIRFLTSVPSIFNKNSFPSNLTIVFLSINIRINMHKNTYLNLMFRVKYKIISLLKS
jgi:hypothetical protein